MGREGAAEVLRKAYLEITDVCNLACAFCPGTQREKGFLSPAGFRTLAGALRGHTEYLYLHLMGEPLLHPQLGELLSIAQELAFRVMVTTNGVLLPQVGELLLESPAVWRVSISLHAFEGNCLDGTLADYLDGCLTFTQQGAAAGKRCVLRLWNLDGADTRGANAMNGEILERIERCFPKPWKEGRQGTTLTQGAYLEWGERFQWPGLNAPEGGETGFCMGLRDQVGVLWDGTVVPCCLDSEGSIPLGNLYRQSLTEILNGPRARAIYNGFSQHRPVEALCRKCGYRKRFD